MSASAQNFVHPEFLIDTETLARRLGEADLRVFDCTTTLIPDPKTTYQAVPAQAEFETGHIPGAQFIDLQADLSDTTQRLRFMKPSAEGFAAAMRRFGVGQDGDIVLYSTGSPWWATRVWWLLRVFGFDNAAVLDGGWQKWSHEGRPVETGPGRQYPPGDFVVREERPLMVGKEAVLKGDRRRRRLHPERAPAGATYRSRRQQLWPARPDQGQRQPAGGASDRSNDQRLPAARGVAPPFRRGGCA